jgi:hypothetical protein
LRSFDTEDGAAQVLAAITVRTSPADFSTMIRHQQQPAARNTTPTETRKTPFKNTAIGLIILKILAFPGGCVGEGGGEQSFLAPIRS